MLPKLLSAIIEATATALSNRLWQFALLVAALVLVSAPQGRGQSAQAAGAPLPTFEVTSIRMNRSGDLRAGALFHPGRFTARAATINLVIALAYNVYPLRIFGAPSWVNSERYDIEAKESDGMAEELRNFPPEKVGEKQALLLQSLLADRFGLRVSHQTKELPVYALVVAKGGPKFQEAKPDYKGPDLPWGPGQFTLRNSPMATLVAIMSNQMHRMVVDQTGLKGNYDLTVEWRKDQNMLGMPREPVGDTRGPEAPPPDSSGPSFFTALQEQLGLKLESTKAPVDVIVIDHIERPTEN
jgi:uncharacterized protein (TIGR03435 family)